MRKVEKLLEAVKDMSSVINPVLDTCLNSSSGSGVYAVLGYPQERCVMYAFAPLTAVCVSMMLVLEWAQLEKHSGWVSIAFQSWPYFASFPNVVRSSLQN